MVQKNISNSNNNQNMLLEKILDLIHGEEVTIRNIIRVIQLVLVILTINTMRAHHFLTKRLVLGMVPGQMGQIQLHFSLDMEAK